jgi:hypothetical protein
MIVNGELIDRSFSLLVTQSCGCPSTLIWAEVRIRMNGIGRDFNLVKNRSKGVNMCYHLERLFDVGRRYKNARADHMAKSLVSKRPKHPRCSLVPD